uniref:Putative flagellar protein FliS n=1 Tax=Magnetococcus massalia (strain MO-1) TaxID=451514 RepID=A0A1S7LNG6_MAGMO|nr:Putative flagellar protein FliS [Candidatus Magnetococcus massalia]
MSYGLRSYKSSRTNTASREDLLILLYEGAIRFLERSIQAFEEGDFPEHKTKLQKTTAIVGELQNTLDFEKGGDLAMQLFDLYNYMLDQLTQVNIKRKIEPAHDVVDLLKTLLDGWRQAVRQVKEQGGMAAAAGASAPVANPAAMVNTQQRAPQPQGVGQSVAQQQPQAARPRLSRPHVL